MGILEEQSEMDLWRAKRHELEEAVRDHKYPELPNARQKVLEIVKDLLPDCEVEIKDEYDPETIYWRYICVTIYTDMVVETKMLSREILHGHLREQLGCLSKEFTIMFYSRESFERNR